MDKTLVAKVDPDVRVGAIAGIEKHQITRPHRLAVNRTAIAGDVGGTANDFHPRRTVVDIAHHTAAIEASLRVFAAEAVAGIDQTQGVDCNLVTPLTNSRLLRYSASRRHRPSGRAATCRKQQAGQDNWQEDRDRFQVNFISSEHTITYSFYRIFQANEFTKSAIVAVEQPD